MQLSSEFLIYPHKLKTYNFLPTDASARAAAIIGVLAQGKKVCDVYDVDISKGVILSDFADEFILKAFTSASETDAILDVDSVDFIITDTDVNPSNIFLYRDVYDGNSEVSTRIDLPLTFITPEVPLQRADHSNIIEFVFDTQGNSHSFRLSNLSLEAGYTYILKFLGVTAGACTLPGNATDGSFEVRFFVVSAPSTQEFAELSTVTNNIYYRMNQLGRLVDVDSILSPSQAFDYQYNPVYWSAIDNNYRPVMNSAFEPVTLRFENSKIIEKLFIKEYLWEFVDYFGDMTDPSKLHANASQMTSEELSMVKSIIFRNSALINTFKGTQDGIRFLHGMYSDSLGYTLISVDPDPYYNFTYSITATLPEAMWENSVKPIVHPLGWGIHYVYIDIDPNLPFIDPGDPLEKFLVMYHEYPSYLDGFNGSLTNLYTPDFVNIVPVIDTQSHRKFNFKESKYRLELFDISKISEPDLDPVHNFYYLTTMGPPKGLNSRGITKEIQDPQNFSFKVGGFDSLDNVNYSFGSSTEGIGTRYQWKLFRRNHLIYTFETSVPKFSLSSRPFSSTEYLASKYLEDEFLEGDYVVTYINNTTITMNWEERLRVQLILRRDDWTALGHEFFTDIHKKPNTRLKVPRIGYLPIDSPEPERDIVNLDLYETCLLDDLRSFKDPREYAGYLCEYPLTDGDGITGTTLSAVVTYLTVPDPWNSVLDSGMLKLTFNRPGIGLEYGWEIHVNGSLINNTMQSNPTLTLAVSPGDVVTTDLTLHNGAWSYTLPTYTHTA
jgi:hypothetical protein